MKLNYYGGCIVKSNKLNKNYRLMFTLIERVSR